MDITSEKQAIEILLRTHVDLDRYGYPIVMMGALPPGWESQLYARAWLYLNVHYGTPLEGENNKRELD